MTNPWQDFLSSRDAGSGDDRLLVQLPSLAASGARLTTQTLLFDLSHLGLIAVRGADAAAFLQGQLTNDIHEATATRSQLSGCCNRKGRLLASVRVIRLAEVIYLQTPRECVPELLKQLRIYVLRAKATLDDASDTLVCIGIAGADAAALLAAAGLTLPERDHAMIVHEDLATIRIPGAVSRGLILGPVAAIAPLWERLAGPAIPAARSDWTLLDIQAGIPTIYRQTAEAFVPQMMNFQLIDGVSFRKGCYTGQEVVARMQHLGTLKRRMYLAEVVSSVPPQPGTALYSSASVSQQETGRVVESAPLGNGRYALLAVVEIAAADSGTVRLGESGAQLQLTAPPYGFSAADPLPVRE